MSISTNSRILYFCSRLPSNVQGGNDLRVRNQILALSKRGPIGVFALTGKGKSISPEISFWQSGSDPMPAREIGPMEILSGVLKEGKNPYWHRYSEVTAEELSEVVDKFKPDAIVISKIALMPYIDAIREAGVARIILDLDETVGDSSSSLGAIIHNPGYRLFHKRYSEALIAYERDAIALADEVWLSSSVEVEHFAYSYPEFRNVTIMPNVINVSDYEKKNEYHIPHRLLFTGNFSYEPNIDAVRFLIDNILPNYLEASLDLVGSHMIDWIANVQHPQVNVVGAVASVVPYFETASIAILPIRAGGGTRLKALEAMAARLPIVSTSIGIEGLELTDGEDIRIANLAEEMIAACQEIEADPQLRSRLTESALHKVKQKYSLEALDQILTQVF